MSPDPFLNHSQDHGGPRMPQLKGGQRLFNQRYELKHPLGAGGMGVVWLSVDHTEETEVALKFLPTVLVLQEPEMKRLREEVLTGKKLRHARIVGTYGLEKEDGIAAIVMEYVSGSTLNEKLHQLEEQERAFFEPEDIAGWVRDLCDALTYLHEEAKRAHRDIKPSNIIVDGEGRALLMDFGISHRIQQSVSKFSKGESGSAASGNGQGDAASSFTLPYTSPQQLSGRPTNASDDLYSLGATIYEMLTGTPPFFRGDVELIRDQIKHEPPVSMSERRKELVEEGANSSTGQEISPAWESAVRQCLAKKREERPTGAAELKTALFAPKAAEVKKTPVLKKAAAVVKEVAVKKAAVVKEGPSVAQRVTQQMGALAARGVSWMQRPAKAKEAAAAPVPEATSDPLLPPASHEELAEKVMHRGHVLMPLILMTALMIPLAFRADPSNAKEFAAALIPLVILLIFSLMGSCGLLRGARTWHKTSIATTVFGTLMLLTCLMQLSIWRVSFLTPGLLSGIAWALNLLLAIAVVRGWRESPEAHRVVPKRGLVLVPLMIVAAVATCAFSWIHVSAASVPVSVLLLLGVIGFCRFFRSSARWKWISGVSVLTGVVINSMAYACSDQAFHTQVGPLFRGIVHVLCAGLVVGLVLGWRHLPQETGVRKVVPAAVAARRGHVLLPLMVAALMTTVVLAWSAIGLAGFPVGVLCLLGCIGAGRLFKRSVEFGVISVACIAAGPVMLLLYVISPYQPNDSASWLAGLHWLYTMLAGGLLLGVTHGYLNRPRTLLAGLAVLLTVGSWKVHDAQTFLLRPGRPVTCVSWSGDDTRLAAAGSYNIGVWNSSTGAKFPSSDSLSGRLLIWSPEKDGLLVCGYDLTLRQAATGDEMHKDVYSKLGYSVRSMGWGGINQRATLVEDDEIHILDPSTSQWKKRGDIKLSDTHSHSWDARYVAEATVDKVNVWDMSTTTTVADNSFSTTAHCLTWSPSHQLIFAADEQLDIWDPSTANNRPSYAVGIIAYSPEFKNATQLGCSPDGKYVAAAISEGYGTRGKHSVTVWDIKSGKKVKTFDTGTNLFQSNVGSRVNTLVWNNASTKIAAGTENGRVFMLDFAVD